MKEMYAPIRVSGIWVCRQQVADAHRLRHGFIHFIVDEFDRERDSNKLRGRTRQSLWRFRARPRAVGGVRAHPSRAEGMIALPLWRLVLAGPLITRRERAHSVEGRIAWTGYERPTADTAVGGPMGIFACHRLIMSGAHINSSSARGKKAKRTQYIAVVHSA